jgi:hypothetical protein
MGSRQSLVSMHHECEAPALVDGAADGVGSVVPRELLTRGCLGG